MIVMVIIRVKIVYINVLMRLVSRTLGHVKLDWLPPSKVDRVNENDKDNESDEYGKNDVEDNSEEGNKSDSDDASENKNE